ncbi:MAG: DUF799 family lipoprotein [Muribaculaceae bacterium]|nr:DUF799 family lipoprotein [Muribaculaceae bacterium]
MKQIVIIIIGIIFLSSCSSKVITRGEQYAKMYEDQPSSIVIMPPINQTNEVEAKDYFYTTLYIPLCEKGYYVFSPYMTMEMFQSESAYDSELFLEGNLSIFREVLGADAAMFTIIKSWKRNVLMSKVTVGIEYILRSTQTGEVIYKREGLISLDTGDSNSILASIINTVSTDKIIVGRLCNSYVLSDMPEGKYSINYTKDQSFPAGKSYIKTTVKK